MTRTAENGASNGSGSAGGTEYFLSVYMQAPDITALAVMRHDQCAALWRRTGDTVHLHRYWEFERVSGVKNHRPPIRFEQDARAFLNELLEQEGLSLDDMSAVWGTPHVSTDDDFGKRHVPGGQTTHSVAHLFSAIGMDWNALRTQQILGLALDAGPDLQLDHAVPETIYSGCVVIDGEVTIVPIESPGPIWLLARGRFKREEGTLMALCSATTCTVDRDVESLVADLPFWTQADVFASADRIIDFAVAEVTSELSTERGRVRSHFDDRFSDEDNLQSAVMKLLERASVAVVDRNVERMRTRFDLSLTEMHLALCGGYALNCPNNSRMMEKYGFLSLMSPPCVNDSGQALGLGLLALHDRGLTGWANFDFGHAFHGRLVSDLESTLEEFAPVIESVGAWTVDDVITDLGQQPIAWVQGEAEIGPRALGHRSILGDPRHEETKDVINAVKQRQWWRPVAPIILEDELSDWFAASRRSPFMLEVFASLPRARAEVPAVLHLDGTARVQTVSATDDAVLYDLVSAFHRRTGVPILANTSLNDRGEPLVDGAAEALTFCVRKGLRVAYIDGVRVRLRADAADLMPLSGPRPRGAQQVKRDAARWASLWQEWTDLGLPPQSLFVYAWNPRLRDGIDPWSAKGARALRLATSAFFASASDREKRFYEHFVTYLGPAADLIPAQASKDFVGGG